MQSAWTFFISSVYDWNTSFGLLLFFIPLIINENTIVAPNGDLSTNKLPLYISNTLLDKQ